MLANDQIDPNINPFLGASEKGSDSIVVQLGSHSIKFGLASQLLPFIIPNVIAYHTTNQQENTNKMDVDDIEEDSEDAAFVEHLNKIQQDIISKEKKVKNAKTLALMNQKNAPTKQQISEIQERLIDQMPGSTASYKKMEEMTKDLNEDINDNNFKWTQMADKPKILVGREALCIPDTVNNEYTLHYPIRFGYFNNNYPSIQVLNDLFNILKFCFENVLRINYENLRNYNIVLLLPDIFIKKQVKMLVNLFLKWFEFKNIFLHLESVMSTFGLAVQSACVVDVGHEKISICCVEEGVILENTVIRRNFGGREVTNMLYLMLKHKTGENKFPYELFDMKNNKHFRIMEKLKENECEFPTNQSIGLGMSQFTPKNATIFLHKKGQNTKKINFTLQEQAYIPPLCLFFSDIIQTFRKEPVPRIGYHNDITGEIFHDPEDLMGDLLKTFALAEKKEETSNTQNPINNLNFSGKKSPNANDEDSISQTPSKSDEQSSLSDEKYLNKKNSYDDMFDTSTGLDNLICQSLMNISSTEMRKKFAGAIILTGGSSKIKEFSSYLEKKLSENLRLLDSEIDKASIFDYPDIDMKTLTWIGGSIIPKLESAKDMWIQRERWLGEPERIEEAQLQAKEKKEEKEEDDNQQNNNGKEQNEVKEQPKEKKKKVERHLDGGVKLIREKCPFAW